MIAAITFTGFACNDAYEEVELSTYDARGQEGEEEFHSEGSENCTPHTNEENGSEGE